MAAASVGAALLGAAPHVLHHAGPLAGAALFAGVGGTLLFGALGLAAATPLLLRMRRRSGSWRRPAAAPHELVLPRLGRGGRICPAARARAAKQRRDAG